MQVQDSKGNISGSAHAGGPLASLHYSGFLLFLIGSLISNTGSQMRTVAVGWEVYHRTGQPLSLGIIGLVLAVPVIVLALPAGAAADRYSRRTLIILSQAGLAVCGLGLAWASHVTAPLAVTYALLLGTGIFRAIGWPASQAIVTGLVPGRDFANAAMWRSVAFQLSATLGPLTGGFLLALYSPDLVYLIDAISSAILVVCLFFVHPSPQARSTEKRSWHSLLEGARFVKKQKVILSMLTLDMVAVLFGGATALLPIYATDVLHVGATGFGWLRAMPSVGAITMGLLTAVLPHAKHAGRRLAVAVVAFGVATIIFGLSHSFPVSLVALFALGAADNISVVIRATAVQLLTPDSMRGRVSSINAVFIGTSNEIGEFESGLAAQWLGTIPAVALGGVMTLLTVGAVSVIWPSLLQLGRLDVLQPADEEEQAKAA